jgi:hypothetical protein
VNRSIYPAAGPNGAVAQLGADITQTNGASLYVAAGASVTFDLNDYSLNISNVDEYNAAVVVPSGVTLNIEDSTGGGTLDVAGGEYGAGIGGGDGGSGGTVTVSGGTVTATGGQYGAVIGGGYYDGFPGSGGSVTVSGGTVSATGGYQAAGIGGGAFGGSGGSMTVAGGTVSATGGYLGAGIGGGDDGSGGSVTIDSGGAMTVGGSHANAIGAGYDGSSFGSLSNAGNLVVTPTVGLDIPSGITVTNTGTIALAGDLFGVGIVINDGVIVVSDSGSVSDNGQGPAGTNLLATGNNYTLSFNLNGDSGTAPPNLAVYAPSVSASEQSLPTPAGDFLGWFTAATGGTQVTNTTELSSVTTPGPSTLTLYAQYEVPQTITFSNPPASPVVGDTYNVSASSTSGVTVALTINGSSSSVCSLSGSTVDFNNAGICQIDASVGALGSYEAASATQTITVAQAPQAITFVDHPPTNATYGGTLMLAATGGASGNPVTFTTPALSVCTVSGTTVTFNGVGTCTIYANQEGNADYLPAPQVQQGFSVGKASTTLVANPVGMVTSLLSLSVTFSGTLTSQTTGKGIAGQSVTFADGPLATCSATTNGSGVATCSSSVLATVALLLSTSYSANYAGDTDYLASRATGTVTTL